MVFTGASTVQHVSHTPHERSISLALSPLNVSSWSRDSSFLSPLHQTQSRHPWVNTHIFSRGHRCPRGMSQGEHMAPYMHGCILRVCDMQCVSSCLYDCECRLIYLCLGQEPMRPPFPPGSFPPVLHLHFSGQRAFSPRRWEGLLMGTALETCEVF